MAIFIKTMLAYCFSFVKQKDLYGKKISITYKGEEEFKTFCGGVISLIIKTILFIYACTLINTVLTHGDTKKSLSKVSKDISTDNTIYYPAHSTFAFAMNMFNSSGYNLLMDETYFEFKLMQSNYNISSGDRRVPVSSTEIPFSSCTHDTFPYLSDKEFDRLYLAYNA